jgi:hypothetical protein
MSRPHPIVLALLASLIGGCALLGLGEPRRLLDQGTDSFQAKDFDAAYRDLSEIRRRYPESSESRQAFPIAASAFKRIYFRDRLTQNEHTGHLAEMSAFMIDWFGSFFGGPEFPEAEARALFLGMPYTLFQEFMARAETRPEISRWSPRAEKDDGIIQSISSGHSASLAE